ncbi:hypothetical protein ACH5RR_037419, partial [Cinchona calisaya]
HQTYQGSGHEEHGAQGDNVQKNDDLAQATQKDNAQVVEGQKVQDVGHGDDDDDEIDATFDYVMQRREPIPTSQENQPHQGQEEVGHDSEETEDNVSLIRKFTSTNEKENVDQKRRMTRPTNLKI